ncbi:MAG: CpaF family protein [Desulfurellaceae bacterium]|nr:CpaF family protein [Desulfurellaceae bacterium]
MPRNVFGRRPKPTAPQPAPAQATHNPPAPAQSAPQTQARTAAAVAGAPEPTGPTRRQTSDGVVADMAAKIHPTVVQSLDMSKAADLSRDELAVQLQSFLDTEDSVASDLTPLDRRRVVQRLVDDIKGLGPLEPLFNDPHISDILVNGQKSVYVERRGRLEQVDIRFRDEQHLLNIAQRIAGWVGRRVDEASPMVDARLPDGSRVNIIIPPLAIDGATFSIRRFVARGISLADLAERNAFIPAMGRLLQICAKARLNILVSGGTGAGKTTFLNALSREISNTERLVTIEDSAELQLQQPHVVRLETRTKSVEGTGEVTIRDLLVNALRMRPDRIIVGEVRGGEANEMLQAMNTGHPGSMCTIHANNPRDALMRLENMLMQTSGDIPLTAMRRQIVSAVDLVVQLARLRSGHRCVTSITDVVGMEGDIVTTEEMWRRLPGEEHTFENTGRQPSWMASVDAAGLRAELLEILQMGNARNVEAAA